jgi:hypothetical protein
MKRKSSADYILQTAGQILYRKVAIKFLYGVAHPVSGIRKQR